MDPEGSMPAGSVPDALTRAGDRIRETAKWLTVSLALIGGVLTAGIQFSNIGSLDPDDVRFRTAITGVALALGGTALILGSAVWTATTPAVSLSRLKPSRHVNDSLLLQGLENLAELRRKYRAALVERREALEDNFDDPGDVTRNAAEIAEHRFDLLDEIVRNVLSVAAYHRLSSRWRQSAAIVLLGALVAVSGIIMFAWATSTPTQDDLTPAGSASVRELDRVQIDFTEIGQELLAPALGGTCPLDEPLQGLVLRDTDSGVEVVIEDDGCTPVRLLVPPEWGSVLLT